MQAAYLEVGPAPHSSVLSKKEVEEKKHEGAVRVAACMRTFAVRGVCGADVCTNAVVPEATAEQEKPAAEPTVNRSFIKFFP